MLYSYSFSNRKRDLSDVFATVIKDEPRFISNFRRVPDARCRKHEWIEDHLHGCRIAPSSCRNGELFLSKDDAAKLRVGTTLCLKNDPALFSVARLDCVSATVRLEAANGSDLTPEKLPFGSASFNIISTPENDGRDEVTVTEWNATQVFHKRIEVGGKDLAINLFGSADNQLNRQTTFALADLARDLNRIALFGQRVAGSDDAQGRAGGLYNFATGEDALEIDAHGRRLDSFIITDAAQSVLGEGGEPTQILCSPGQVQVLWGEFQDRIQVLRSDDRRGAYVASIVNANDARGLTIIADPDVPDCDAWVLDPAGFGLANLKGNALRDEDATPKGFDGIRRCATGELTFEFLNVRQRCRRIKNLLPSVITFGI